jgi:hypothetical protein
MLYTRPLPDAVSCFSIPLVRRGAGDGAPLLWACPVARGQGEIAVEPSCLARETPTRLEAEAPSWGRADEVEAREARCKNRPSEQVMMWSS